MERKKNIHGGGSNTNKNGLSFEEKTNLLDALKDEKNIEIKNKNEIYVDNELFGFYYEKYKFYKDFLEKKLNINWKERVGRQMLPDAVFVNIKTKTVYIFEKKYQERSGSVDQKIETCGFKKNQYNKLLKNTDYLVQYGYLLNDWYCNKIYVDVKEHIIEEGCFFYINEIPKKEIGL